MPLGISCQRLRICHGFEFQILLKASRPLHPVWHILMPWDSSVPLRVNFTKITFDGKDSLIIEGMAFSDQDILNFIGNLNAKSLIEQASLAAMKVETSETAAGNNNKKGFIINCKLKAI